MRAYSDLKIAVAGTGYVGLSIAILLAQHHEVMAVDIVPERVQKINNKQATIHDDYVEKYLREEKITTHSNTGWQKRIWRCRLCYSCNPNKL